jgi:hypothetical protein
MEEFPLKTKSGMEYELVPAASVRLSLARGFSAMGDSPYIDEHMIDQSAIGDGIAVIPEIDEKGGDIIENTVEMFQDYAQENGNLPGQMLQNMATWMVAWSLEMAWCWTEGELDECVFAQDMGEFRVPMDRFALLPQQWIGGLVNSFGEWSYSHPGYTDQHEIDIFDPIRDGYLTMMRIVLTKVLPSL